MKFKLGDKVITSSGAIGRIVGIEKYRSYSFINYYLVEFEIPFNLMIRTDAEIEYFRKYFIMLQEKINLEHVLGLYEDNLTRISNSYDFIEEI